MNNSKDSTLNTTINKKLDNMSPKKKMLTTKE